jgi:DNA-binding transcriptional MerR regulator
MSTQEGPFFNLKAVVQQTGLKPDTLRAWERRYGLPAPKRSSGGHRLYTWRDIDTIKWLMARQGEGLSIKRAVELWRQIESEGQDPLAAPGGVVPAAGPMSAPAIVGETLAQLRKEWIDACLAYDERRSEQVLAQAFALYPPETVCLELLREAMAQIGARWYQNEVTVQQEHFCSALAIRRLEGLVMAAPLPTRQGRILASCPPQEEHTFGLLLLTFLLRRRGWGVVYLGANVPVERLETTVAVTKPNLVIMAAQKLHSAATLLEAARLLQREGVALAFGGLVFNLAPNLRARIPGHFLGDNLEAAVRQAEALMTASRKVPMPEPIPESYRHARDHFVERAGLIEAQLGEFLNGAGIGPSHLAVANRELALNIGAALALGDMDLMGTDLEWIEGLLSHHEVPVEMLRHYLAAYHEAAKAQLDERGELVLDWFENAIEQGTQHKENA